MAHPQADPDAGDDGRRGEMNDRAFRVGLGVVLGVLALFPGGYGLILALAGPWATGGGIMAVGAGPGLVALACIGAGRELAPPALFLAVVLILLGLLVCVWGPESGRLVID